jgi:hypothetical protein
MRRATVAGGLIAVIEAISQRAVFSLSVSPQEKKRRVALCKMEEESGRVGGRALGVDGGQ